MAKKKIVDWHLDLSRCAPHIDESRESGRRHSRQVDQGAGVNRTDQGAHERDWSEKGMY